MTRLSSFTSENKLAKIDRRLGATINKENKKSSQGALGSRRPLGEQMMNVQRGLGGGDGLKRRADEDGKASIKRPRIGVVLRDREAEQEMVHPRTPPRRMGAGMAVQPTPARDILAAEATKLDKQEADDEDEDEDESPEIPNRFIARPPTPPRPHMQLAPVSPILQMVKTPSPIKMDIDSPIRPTHVKESVTPTQRLTTRDEKTARPPVTPRSTIPTPRRAMGSISRFRAAPSSIRRPVLSPLKSQQETTEPILASLLAEETKIADVREESMEETNATTDVSSDIDMGVQVLNENADGLPGSMPVSSLSHVIETRSDNLLVSDTVSNAKEPPASAMPSRIPRPASMLAPQSSTTAAGPTDLPKKSSIPVLSKSAASTMTLGRGLPRAAPSSTTLSSTTGAGSTGPVRRKPSYPASLGSGPLARPRDRMVSGPTLYRQQDGTLGAQKVEPTIPKGRQSPRSVSEPVPRPKSSLSSSTARREGLSLETSKSIAGLSDALNKLKVKRPDASSEPNRPKPSARIGLGPPSKVASSSVAPAAAAPSLIEPTTSSSSRLSSVHRPRQSMLPPAKSPDSSISSEEECAGDKSLAAIMSSTSGGGCFRGVVAFIDVKTSDGEDAGPIFTAMIKALGGKVSSLNTDREH